MRALLALLLLAFTAPALATEETVAVLYFDNEGNPELEPLKVGLAQMLITDLGASDAITVVERARLQAILDELDLGHDGVVDPSTAARVGRLLGAGWLVLGSYFELMGTLRVDARLVHVETGAIRFAHGVSGPPGDFLVLEDRLAAALRGAVDDLATPDRPPEPSPTRGGDGGTRGGDGGTRGGDGGSDAAIVPPDADALAAALAFSEGLIALDRADQVRAREAFRRAVATDARLEEARAALAAMDP